MFQTLNKIFTQAMYDAFDDRSDLPLYYLGFLSTFAPSSERNGEVEVRRVCPCTNLFYPLRVHMNSHTIVAAVNIPQYTTPYDIPLDVLTGGRIP